MEKYKKELKQWKYNEAMSISAEHFAWGSDKVITGAAESPTFKQLHDEMFNVTIEGSDSRRVAMEHNPGFVGFIDHVAKLEQQLADSSQADGKAPEWWKSAGGGLENQEMKREYHEWYIGGLEYEIQQMEMRGDEQGVLSATWMLERILTPLLSEVEYTDVVFFPPIEPPVPSQDWVNPEEGQTP